MATTANIFIDQGSNYSNIITVTGANGNALDLTGVDKKQIALELEKEAATNLKRVLRPNTKLDGLARIKVFLETKTVWHPRGF